MDWTPIRSSWWCCNHGFFQTIHAESTPAMMSLQARWAPAIQAAAVTELLGDLEDGETFSDFARLARQALSRSQG
ncbi:hypothetical protein [Streptomyces viridosporus]|uniref:hypothetical protein n=1 Tax=Streptomyces viridosporus TaxID=67581 RepID=UPI0036FDB4B1